MKEKIIKFFKEEWKFLIFITCFYFLMAYEFPYAIYTPGGSINMSERISGDNLYKEDGSLSMTYVSLVKARLPFLALSYIIPNWDVKDASDVTYDNEDMESTFEIDRIYMEESISNAMYVALTNANVEYSVTKTKNIITHVAKEAKTNLKYGDKIIDIDGIRINSIKELQNYIEGKSVGDIVNIKYIRKDKEYTDKVELIEIDGKTKAGISLAFINEYDSKYNIKVKSKSSEAGPSGGLITALAIYNQITEYDLTKGHTIMGTGTIEKDGTVGEIGGVKYKLIGAYKKGADVFICPKENYEEAIKVKKDNKYDIMIIGAGTFSEALDELDRLKE